MLSSHSQGFSNEGEHEEIAQIRNVIFPGEKIQIIGGGERREREKQANVKSSMSYMVSIQ